MRISRVNVAGTNTPAEQLAGNASISESEINNYRNLFDETVECVYCNRQVSITKVVLYRGCKVCCDCAIERHIPLHELMDAFHQSNYSGTLYRCSRIHHYKPRYLLRFDRTANTYTIERH